MTNEDYREILQSTRQMLKQAGLSGVDERIMSDIRGSDGPFWDLIPSVGQFEISCSLKTS
jgi:hypothetical protein